MGPGKAMEIFVFEHPDADSYEVHLFGSLADTGKGHGTDTAINMVCDGKPCEIIFNRQNRDLPHENTMDIYAYSDGVKSKKMRVMSVGGGDIKIEGRVESTLSDIYPESSFASIAEFCKKNNLRISEFVLQREGEEIVDFLQEVWQVMKNAVARGISKEGVLPGGLNVQRKAKYLYEQRNVNDQLIFSDDILVCSYAYAVSEENADNGTIVTAPTCGACGVLPAVLVYMQERHGYTDKQIIDALAVAGIIGNLTKTNASISGAECGCQAEIGTACAMTSAALAELFDMSIDQIEYAAEIAFEHHLGLTCDPICGLVQIPCIERNAVAAMRAINAVGLAKYLSDSRKISLDTVIKSMYETGKDLSFMYRETSTGGLAKHYKTS